MTLNPANADSLAQHIGGLRALARALVSGVHDAEDLLQDAFVLAAQRAAPPSGNQRAWLARILQNLARSRFRSSERRARREARVALPEHSAPSSVDLAARSELLELVLRSVLDLDTPLRDAVLLCFFEGRRQDEAARTLNISSDALRRLLQRALSDLRTRLDRAHGERPRAWCAPLCGLLGIAEPSSAVTWTLWIGVGIVMKKILGVAAALLLFALGAWWIADGLGHDADPSPRTGAGLAAGAASPDADSALQTVIRDNTGATNSRSSADASELASSRGALRLRALDQEGRAIPKAGFVVYSRAAWQTQREYALPLWKADCDVEGRASWPEARAQLDALEGQQGFAVMLDRFVPFGSPLAIEHVDQLQREHTLTAPAFGSVTLRVWTPLEQPLATGVADLVAWTGRGTQQGDLQQRDQGRRFSIVDGVACFPFVALGTPLRATAGLVVGPEVDAEIPALSQAGEGRVVDLRLGSDRVVLRLRVISEEGRPIVGDTTVKLDLRSQHSGASHGIAGTDSTGVMWVAPPARGVAHDEVELSLQGFGSGNEGNAEVRALIAQPRGMIDLGDVVLRRGPLVVAGRVMLTDGSPASGASLRARFTRSTSVRGGFDDPPSAYLRVENSEGTFAWHESLSRATPETRIQIEAELDRRGEPPLRARPQEVALGSSAVEVRLEALGTVEATWSEGAPWRYGDFSARLVPIESALVSHSHSEGQVRQHGISFPPQLAGRYVMRLRANGGAEPLLEISDLVVEAGRACDDPRLRAIDLSTIATRLEYELIASYDKSAALAGRLHVRPSDANGVRWSSREFQGGIARAVLPRGRYDVILHVTGARAVRFAKVESGQRVELTPAIAATLVLEGRPESLAEGERLLARLHRLEDGAELMATSEHFDESGAARIALPLPGSYHVAWRRVTIEGTGLTDREMDTAPITITVPDLVGEQRLPIPAPRPKEDR